MVDVLNRFHAALCPRIAALGRTLNRMRLLLNHAGTPLFLKDTREKRLNNIYVQIDERTSLTLT